VPRPSTIFAPIVVPVLFSLGPLTVYTFGAMMALGFLVGGYAVSEGLERKGMDPEEAWSIVLWAAVGGIAGSRVLAILGDLRAFFESPLGSLISGSGFVWYGGLIGGLLSVTIFLRVRGMPWLRSVDCIAPGAAIGQAIGRIGCQVSGDGDWGHATTLPWGVAYPDAIVGWSVWLAQSGLPPETRVHPAPVYETLAYSAIFVVLWKMRDRGLPDGSVLWTYLVLSSVARFLIEAVRIEPVLALGLTEAQWIALGLAAVGSFMLARGVRAREAAA
jgi:phosphatidylglycerol---prolipoprotein diacylglyceryl transferase